MVMTDLSVSNQTPVSEQIRQNAQPTHARYEVRMTVSDMLNTLAQRPHTADSFNPYALDDAWGAARRHNLTLYLETMIGRCADTLLLMEAPGYRGCRVTGIPATSRQVLLSGVGVFAGAYQDTHEVGFELYQREQTSTILWNTLAALAITPLVWNAVPFHPHQAANPHSNRPPRPSEIQEGITYLQSLQALFTLKHIIAVGNSAARALTRPGIPHHQIRHPAQGGKTAFVRGLTEVADVLQRPTSPQAFCNGAK